MASNDRRSSSPSPRRSGGGARSAGGARSDGGARSGGGSRSGGAEPKRAGGGSGDSRRDSRRDGRGDERVRGNSSGSSKPKPKGRRDTDLPEIKRWVDYPAPKYSPVGDAESPPTERNRLRKPARSAAKAAAPEQRAPKQGTPKQRTPQQHPAKRRRLRQTEAIDELSRLAGSKRTKIVEQLHKAAELFRLGREREALRVLRPLAEAYPDAAGVQELLGLCHYRIGQFPAARKALERFVEITNSTEQHPVLMDCLRAAGKHRDVERLWAELAEASPGAALVAEGRIVMAGSYADRGDLTRAIGLLERRSEVPKRVLDHHLRLWYALGDLHDRAGNAPAARRWFSLVLQRDRHFVDVVERLAALGR